jgi:hypothetical protein
MNNVRLNQKWSWKLNFNSKGLNMGILNKHPIMLMKMFVNLGRTILFFGDPWCCWSSLHIFKKGSFRWQFLKVMYCSCGYVLFWVLKRWQSSRLKIHNTWSCSFCKHKNKCDQNIKFMAHVQMWIMQSCPSNVQIKCKHARNLKLHAILQKAKTISQVEISLIKVYVMNLHTLNLKINDHMMRTKHLN